MKIEVEYGETANAGNYESVRIACRSEIHLDDFATAAEVESAKKRLLKQSKVFVQKEIIREMKSRSENV